MHNFRLALRQLLKNPGFTAVAVISLAVGLALAATTFATVNSYLIRSVPYPTARQVYHVMYAPPGPWEPRGMSAIDWSSLSNVVEHSITASGATYYVMDAGSVRTMRTLQVSPGFFAGLGIQPVLGRTFAPEESDSGSGGVTLISYEQWVDRFGSDPQIIGRRIEVTHDETGRSSESLEVVGVLPAGFWFGRSSDAKVDFLTPLRSRMQTYMVQLRDGVPPDLAEKRITEAARSVGSDFRPGWTGVHLESVHARYMERIQPVLTGTTIAVAVVLALVCANVAVLFLLRAMRRQKEVAVRVSLGANRKHILCMLLSEAGLICGAALVGGLVLTAATLRALTPIIEAQLGKPAPAGPSAIHLDSTVFVVLGGISLVIALSLALAPLLATWQERLADALRSQGTSATEGRFMRKLRNSLIAVEVAGSLVLLAGCGLMIRSVVNLMNTDMGFNPEHVIRIGIRLPARTYVDTAALSQFFTGLLEKLPRDPGSQVVMNTAFPSFYPANKHTFEAGETTGAEASVGMLQVGAGYFSLYGVRLDQGREFTPDDRLGSEPVALVSASLANRLWPSGSAVGRSIRVAEGDMPDAPMGPWRTIVGVVGDIRQGYDDTDLGDLYLPFLQTPRRFASVHLRTNRSPTFWEQSVRSAARDLDPYAQVGTVRTIVSEDRQRAGTRFLTSMLSGFSLFALLLAVLGIYGVTTYAVQQREREIAIRVAVGANRRNVITLFLKQGTHLLAIGLGLGLLGCIGAARILESAVYGVPPLDIVTLISACVLMTAVGLSAVWWPAKRATRLDPMTVLRSE